MEYPDLLPFKVGQLAEAKSFMKGFRGAWFRCKIHEIVVKNGHISHALEYIDFPDEKMKVKWTRIYQVSVWIKIKGKEKERQLMVRPQYPCTYDEINLPLVEGITKLSVETDDVWKVGDLVDWLTDGCFWTGRLTQIFNDGNAEVTLIPPPVGEGRVYKVSCKDLRPSLDWSPEYGWRAPSLQEDESSYNYARLIQQLKQGINNTGAPAAGRMKCDIDYKDEGSKDVDDKTVSPIHASISSHNSANSLRASKKSDSRKIRDMTGVSGSIVPKTRRLEDLEMRNSGLEKPSLSDSVCSSHIKCASTETAVHTAPEDLDNSEGAKKVKTGGSPPLNIKVSDSLDPVLMDLEELANKIQWLKGILDFGIPSPNGTTPSWKLVEHRGSSTPK